MTHSKSLFFYHVIAISRNNSRATLVKFIRLLSRKFKIIIAKGSLDPVYHVHAIIVSNRPIRYDILHFRALYVRVKPIKHRVHFNRTLKYIKQHNETFINYECETIHGGGNVPTLEELEERIRRIENAIERLTDYVMNERQTTQGESREVSRQPRDEFSVDLRKIKISVREGRKGKALIIKFANFIKQSRDSSYYVILSDEDLNALAEFFRRLANGRARKTGAKVERGFKKALE